MSNVIYRIPIQEALNRTVCYKVSAFEEGYYGISRFFINRSNNSTGYFFTVFINGEYERYQLNTEGEIANFDIENYRIKFNMIRPQDNFSITGNSNGYNHKYFDSESSEELFLLEPNEENADLLDELFYSKRIILIGEYE